MHHPFPPFLRFIEAPEGQSGDGGGQNKQDPPEKPESGTADGKQAEDKGRAGGENQLLADLAKERKARQALEQKFADAEKSDTAMREAFAAALGLKPEETSDTDKLSQQLTTLTEQFATAQRENQLLKVVANPGEDAEGNPLPAIPKEYQHLLTATDPDALAAQAKSVAELVKARGGQEETPAFAGSNGQGQGGSGKQPPIGQQIAEAERDLGTKTPGTPEHRAAQQKVAQLKSQQLAALKPQ